MRQRIEYTNGGDTGFEDSDSIQPIVDGEPAKEETFQRPTENLRSRTEIVRTELEDNKYLRDADRRLGIFGGGTVTYGGNLLNSGTGIFTTTADLYLIPFNTVGNNASTPPVASKFGTLIVNKTGPASGLTITSKKRNYAGGDKISVQVLHDETITGNVEVEVQDTYRIKLTVKTATTLGQVSTAITGDVDANALISSALAGGASSGDAILSPQAEQYVSGNFDSEAHVITAANLASFFSTSGNRLDEGDSLCVWYNENIEGTIAADSSDPKGGSVLGGRRESIVENSNTTVPVGSLFNSRLHPERLPNALPVCKIVGDALYFIDGSSFAKNAAGSMGTSGYVLKTELAATTASKGASLVGIQDSGALIAATTVEGALAELATGRVLRAGDTMSGNLLANATGIDLGSSSARWDLFAEAAKVYASLSAGVADTVDIGSTGTRFRGIHGNFMSANGTGSSTVALQVGGALSSITSGMTMQTLGAAGIAEIWDGYGYRQRYGVEFKEDFYGDAFDGSTNELNSQNWAQAMTGTSVASMSTSFSTSVELVTDSTISHTAIISTRNLVIPNTVFPHFFARVRFGAALTSRSDTIGLTYINFLRDTASSDNIKIFTVSSTIDTGFAPSLNTWYYLQFQVRSGGTIDWAIGTSPLFTSALASSMGDSVTYFGSPSEMYFNLTNKSGASRTLIIDYAKVNTGSIL